MKRRSTPLLLMALLLLTTAAHASMVFVDINGKTHDLANYKGQWVLLNFFATWCPPCLQEIPELVFLNDRHKGVAVIGVDMENLGAAKLRRFAESYLISYPIIPFDKHMPMVGKVTALPTSYLINPQGKLIAKKVGSITADEVKAFIKRNSESK